MLLTDSASIREADKNAIEMAEIPSTELMTNAAEAVASAALEFLSPGDTVLVFCGAGNNGGDGIAAGLRLLGLGHRVRLWLVGAREQMTEDAREMERRLYAQGGRLDAFDGSDDYADAFADAAVVIDALFGVGLSRPLGGDALRCVELMNRYRVPVVSCDIPSGVSADTGEILGGAVCAAVTVTFSMPKVGHFAAPGCTCRGELRVADIGIPGEFLFGCGIKAVTAKDIPLPPRTKTAHKGDFGRILVLGGSVGYTGAPTLSARAALRCGGGLVSLGVPEAIYPITAMKNDEAMPFPLPSDSRGSLSAEALPVLRERLSGADAAVLGPGLGRSAEITELVCALLREATCPLILDADALYAIREHRELLRTSPALCIITPHEGEFTRLTGQPCRDRIGEAYRFAREYNCVVVLKGHATVCAFPTGEVFLNTTGGPALAKGGSGDVLAGMLGALLCRLPLKRAVTAAVWLHGRAGDLCAETLGEDCVLAGDVIDAIPRAMEEIRERK